MSGPPIASATLFQERLQRTPRDAQRLILTLPATRGWSATSKDIVAVREEPPDRARIDFQISGNSSDGVKGIELESRMVRALRSVASLVPHFRH